MSVSEKTINNWVNQIDKDAAKEQLEKVFNLWLACHTQEEIAKIVEMPQQTVARKIKDFTQIGKLSDLGKISANFSDYQVPLYNVWSWGKKSNEVSHPGNSEQSIVENIIYAYTDPFDIVVDPFAGGGSTIDVCKKRFRRYFVSDLTPIVAREREIRQHDISKRYAENTALGGCRIGLP